MHGDPNTKFLFRYRDLMADSISEHRFLIRTKGYCWWGWWKKPNEPGHLEVWHEISETIRRGSRVIIGLFNSGTGQVHQAVADQVVIPSQNEFEEFMPVTPPSGTEDLIPDYYRSGSYSRAWLRLASIGEYPVDFFGHFSYDRPPHLPHYPASQTARLAGKRIIDEGELRAMDTTIWTIRPTKATDSSERFLTAKIGPQEPVSAQPVNCPGHWLLHITDPHYAVDRFRMEHQRRLEGETPTARLTMVDAISNSLTVNDRNIGAVLLTGDLTYAALPQEFTAAEAGLRKLTNGLGLSTDHLVVIPGNHDIAWTRKGSYRQGSAVDIAPEEATANYRNFFLSLYGYSASQHLSMARRFIFPGGSLLDIVAVNSSSLEQGKRFLAGMGRVQEAGYQEATRELSWSNQNTLGLRILALHHHLALTENLESPNEYSRGFGIAVDAPRIQRMAARDGVQLALHGHKHRAFVWRTGAYHLPDSLNEFLELGNINIIGGGSCGSKSTENRANFFNLIKVSDNEVRLEIYRSQNQGMFERIITFVAPLTMLPSGRLGINSWKEIPAPSK